MDKEFIDRFKILYGRKGQAVTPQILVSDNHIIGIPMDFKEENYLEYGKFKFRKSLPCGIYLDVAGKLIDSRYLKEAMYVCRRRLKIRLGFYQLSAGWVFALREKDNVILIAPCLRERDLGHINPLKDLVVRMPKKVKEFNLWAKIMGGFE